MSSTQGATKADYEIQSFTELCALLEKDFGIELPAAPAASHPRSTHERPASP